MGHLAHMQTLPDLCKKFVSIEKKELDIRKNLFDFFPWLPLHYSFSAVLLYQNYLYLIAHPPPPPPLKKLMVHSCPKVISLTGPMRS